MRTVTCNRCGWVHFQVSRAYAEDQVKRFNAFYDALTPEDQETFYGGRGATLDLYLACHSCSNPYTDFRESKPGDHPRGATLGPIIDRNE